MSSIRTEFLSQDNLLRAWRWIRSNADANYKSFFRDMYSVYAIADEELLRDLRSRLSRGIYEPSHSCKIFFPKPSGILRPYALLTIEDQIVYQAAVNAIAERLYPKVSGRYYKEVFGHLYAGKKNTWFYRKWSTGYQRFNKVARQAYADGFTYTASFDLTACYDSMDHRVLRYFLSKLGCEKEFCDQLTSWLSKWTASNHNIYHNHGIPQGPLSSGLLSEVVLKHFDEKRGREATIKYFRYVDDIKLFAKDEKSLRRMLVRLDELSKEIGLFPQTSKISLHKVTDIEDELKSVSSPTEASVQGKSVDQEKVRRRLVDLSPRYVVSNPTRFKYVLAHAEPSCKITERLWKIFERAPEYYGSIARYLSSYATIPKKAADRLVDEIYDQKLYQSVVAQFVQTLQGRVPSSVEARAKKIIGGKWRPCSMQADNMAAVGRWMLHYNQFSYRQIQTASRDDKPWWPRARITLDLNDELIGKPSLEKITNILLRDKCDDVALAAASVIYLHGLQIERPRRDLNKRAAKILKELGILRRAPGHVCGIHSSFERMIGSVPDVNWKKFFGPDYRKAEKQIIICRALAETNITAWVNAYDVFCDWLLSGLYRNDSSLGTYNIGGIGSVMDSSRLFAEYPSIQTMIKEIHEKRYQSNLSHAKQKRTGKATRTVKFSYLRTVRPILRAAIYEVSVKW